MNINRNDLCPCGSGKKFKNCCYNNIQKEEKEKTIEIIEEKPSDYVPSLDNIDEDEKDVKTYDIPEIRQNQLYSLKEHAKKIQKIREQNKDNPNFPSGSINWKEIENIREENKDNPNYPHVYWITDDSLYVKVGDFEQKGISVEEAIELFKDNKLFMDELKYLLEDYEDTRIGSLENENSYKAHL